MDLKKSLASAMVFILMLGVVSLLADMTHEGAASIRGAYLALLGASAATIVFISGLGELIAAFVMKSLIVKYNSRFC